MLGQYTLGLWISMLPWQSPPCQNMGLAHFPNHPHLFKYTHSHIPHRNLECFKYHTLEFKVRSTEIWEQSLYHKVTPKVTYFTEAPVSKEGLRNIQKCEETAIISVEDEGWDGAKIITATGNWKQTMKRMNYTKFLGLWRWKSFIGKT